MRGGFIDFRCSCYILNRMIDLVIARHSEDINWLDDPRIQNNCRIFLYNKGGDFNGPSVHHYEVLENTGRESHTYLTHIIKNYNNLTDKTIFLQAHPFDHCNDNFYDFINAVINQNFNFLPLHGYFDDYKPYKRQTKEFPVCTVSEDEAHPNLQMSQAIKSVFGDTVILPKKLFYTCGAQFACSKETITTHSKSFYERVLGLHLNNYDLPFQLERMWWYIFQHEDVYHKNISL
jgi:hypothetical protein